MRVKSFDAPPIHGKAIHQGIDQYVGLKVRGIGQVGIAGSGQDAVVAEDFLNFEQVDARPSTALRTGFD
jgi:hypothetical protein